MTLVGRITTRLCDPDDGLAICSLVKNQTFFKPQHVYEIVEVMGELIIREVGPSWITMDHNKSFVTWNSTIDYILEDAGRYLGLSKIEYDRIVNKQNKKEDE